jgi:predicted ABC-type ATPase
MTSFIIRLKGGKGSGFYGHSGRPGKLGGSSPESKFAQSRPSEMIGDGGSEMMSFSFHPKHDAMRKEELVGYLKQIEAMQKYSREGIVLKNGKYYKPQPLPKKYKFGTVKECFRNAYQLTDYNGDLQYVEGFAVPDFVDLPIWHAWAVDKEGNVVDNTWRTPGVLYFGIPFDRDFMSSVVLETEHYGIMDFRSKTFRDKYANGLDEKSIRRGKELIFIFKGGKGSGNHGHAGIPGHRGGSLPGSGIVVTTSVEGKAHGPRSGYRPLDKMPFAGKKANPDGVDTLSQYRNPDGTWTPERQALHTHIIASFFEGKTPVDNPTSYILGGGPAVGKTTLVKSGLVNLPDNMVLVAGDDIKLLIPEYEPGKVGSAAFVHEESSYLSKEVARIAASKKFNLLMDGTGDSAIDSLTKKVASMKAQGQPVKGIYVTCDMKTALERSAARAEKTGRFMPESVLVETHKSVSAIFPKVIETGILDSMDLYDTSSGKAVHIATAVGKKLKILDSNAYKVFLDKENYGTNS